MCMLTKIDAQNEIVNRHCVTRRRIKRTTAVSVRVPKRRTQSDIFHRDKNLLTLLKAMTMIFLEFEIEQIREALFSA